MMWLIMISPTELQLWGAFTMFGRLPRPCCQDALLLLESSFKREYSSEKKLERNEESYHQLVVNVMEVQGARVSGVGKFLDLKTSMAETEECLGCLGNSMYFRPVLNRL